MPLLAGQARAVAALEATAVDVVLVTLPVLVVTAVPANVVAVVLAAQPGKVKLSVVLRLPRVTGM